MYCSFWEEYKQTSKLEQHFLRTPFRNLICSHIYGSSSILLHALLYTFLYSSCISKSTHFISLIHSSAVHFIILLHYSVHFIILLHSSSVYFIILLHSSAVHFIILLHYSAVHFIILVHFLLCIIILHSSAALNHFIFLISLNCSGCPQLYPGWSRLPCWDCWKEDQVTYLKFLSIKKTL